MTQRALRLLGVAMAALAFFDPVMVRTGRTRPLLSLNVQDGPSMQLPGIAPASNRLASAKRAADEIRATLGDEYDIADGVDPTAAAAIVLGDRYPDEPLRENVRASTVTVSAPLDHNVRIVGVSAPDTVPPLTAMHLVAIIEGTAMRGETTSVVIRSAGATLARSSHAWTDGRETWRAEFDVIPVGAPPFGFDITAEPVPAERTALDNRATIRVDQAQRLRVHVVEARPSWTAAFVRRALERDARFELSGVSHASPRALVRTGETPGSSTLAPPGTFDDADVVIVGGLDALPAATASALERFMRSRGGAVVFAPDSRRLSAAASGMLGGVDLRETLLDQAATLAGADSGAASLDASELLEAPRVPHSAIVVRRAAASGAAVIWAVQKGAGTLLFSGAMDAWRYRASPSNDFDRFWRSAIAGLALDVSPRVAVDVSPRRAAAGERIRIVARVRRDQWRAGGDSPTVSARTAVGPVRLWPSAVEGVFTGSFVFEPRAGQDSETVTVELNGANASGLARVTLDANARDANDLPLLSLSATRRGVDVAPGDVTTLIRHVRSTVEGEIVKVPWHPMRSPWVVLIFISSLSGEWWMRRRAGLR